MLEAKSGEEVERDEETPEDGANRKNSLEKLLFESPVPQLEINKDETSNKTTDQSLVIINSLLI